MAQSQNGHGDLSDVLGVSCPADSLKPIFWGPGSRSELQSLSNSEMREMTIDFLVVKDFTLKEIKN